MLEREGGGSELPCGETSLLLVRREPRLPLMPWLLVGSVQHSRACRRVMGPGGCPVSPSHACLNPWAARLLKGLTGSFTGQLKTKS